MNSCEECGLSSSGRRTWFIPCNKMICPSCWKFGFGCKYSANREKGIMSASKPHRSNIKSNTGPKDTHCFVFSVSHFGKRQVPVVTYGDTVAEARETAKLSLKKGEKLEDPIEIDGIPTNWGRELLKREILEEDERDRKSHG